MDKQFVFWYPIVEEKQLDFEGREHIKQVFCEGHIVHNGRLMCGESREVIKNKAGAKKEKTQDSRAVTPKMCPVCLKAWKAHPDSSYYKYVNGVPSKITNIERPLVNA